MDEEWNFDDEIGTIKKPKKEVPSTPNKLAEISIPPPPIVPITGWSSVKIIAKESPTGTVKAKKIPTAKVETLVSTLTLSDPQTEKLELQSTKQVPHDDFVEDIIIPTLRPHMKQIPLVKINNLIKALKEIEDIENGLLPVLFEEIHQVQLQKRGT
jgi:hypothetical protein